MAMMRRVRRVVSSAYGRVDYAEAPTSDIRLRRSARFVPRVSCKCIPKKLVIEMAIKSAGAFVKIAA